MALYCGPVLRHSAGAIQAANFRSAVAFLINPALIGSHLGWCTIAVPGDEPGFAVASSKLDERGS